MGVFDLFRQEDPDTVSSRNVRNWISDLQSGGPELREEAARNLVAAGGQAFLPLIESIPSADSIQRAKILGILRALPGITTSAICTGLRRNCDMKTAEVIEFFALPGREGIAGLLRDLTDDDAMVRSIAAGAIARIGEPAVPLLEKALSHRSYRLRSGAADTLIRMRWSPKTPEDNFRLLIAQQRWAELARAKKAAVPYLTGCLEDRYYRIRIGAAKTLGIIGDQAAVKALGGLLSDTENEVCISAIEALGTIGHETCVPFLVRSLGHGSTNVRHMAATTLSAYGWSPVSFEDRARFYLAMEEWHELAHMGRPAIPFLIQALSNPQFGRQEGVATALKAMGRPGMEALLSAVHGPDAAISKAASDILAGLSSRPRDTGDRKERTEVPDPANAAAPATRTPRGTARKDPESRAPPQPSVPRERAAGSLNPGRGNRAGAPGPGVRPPAPDPVSRESGIPEQPGSMPEREFSPLPPVPQSGPAPEREPDFSGLLQHNETSGDTTEDDIRELVRSLGSPDENIRTLAIDALGRIGARAIDVLGTALSDPSWEVRAAAAEALGKIRNERAVPLLAGAIRDPDEDVRAQAARSLGEIGEFSGFLPLVLALEDGDYGVCRNAEIALSRFGHQATAPVSKLATHSNPQVRGSAAAVLGRIGLPGTFPVLVSLFDDPEPSVREKAAIALGGTGAGSIPLLAGILTDGNPGRRLCAVTALGHAGREAEEYLVSACRDTDPAVRECARSFLDRLHPAAANAGITGTPGFSAPPEPSGPAPGIAGEPTHAADGETAGTGSSAETGKRPDIGPLLDGLTSPFPKTRLLSIQSLGRIGDRRAVSPLQTLLTALEPSVRQAAADAIGQIGDPVSIPALIRLLADPYEQVRKSAVRALGRTGHEDAVPGLIGALSDDDYSLRTEAGDTLVVMGKIALPGLVRALSHPSRKIRRETALCLDQTEWQPESDADRAHYLIAKESWIELSGLEAAALPAISRLVLNAGDEDLRIGAILALVKMENTEAIGYLIQALRDKSFLVRRRAITALVEKGDSAIPPLQEASRSDDIHIRTASEQILDRISRRCIA